MSKSCCGPTNISNIPQCVNCGRQEEGLELNTCTICGKTETCNRCTYSDTDKFLNYCTSCRNDLLSDKCPICNHVVSKHSTAANQNDLCQENVVLFVSEGPCNCDLAVRIQTIVEEERKKRESTNQIFTYTGSD